MATALYSFKIEADGSIKTAHIFFGETDEAAANGMKKHAAICPKFGPAVAAGETIEEYVEIDAIPAGDEVSIAEFLQLEDDDETDALAAGADDDEADEDEDD